MSDTLSCNDSCCAFRTEPATGMVTNGGCRCLSGLTSRQQKFIRDLRRENAELRKKLEWQPIETAPKDGSPILLYSSDDGCHQGYWFEGSDDTGWCTDGLFSNGWTHWMPLPEPPK